MRSRCWGLNLSSPDLAIRLRRAAFNRALADGDVDAIAAILRRDAILVTGTDSAVISGRKAQLLSWKREFSAAARTIYTRTPDTIVVSPLEPIAMEQGQWRCVMAADDAFVASGIYSAKWREIAGEWLVEAEVYLTLA